MVVSNFIPTCGRCKKSGNYFSRDKTPPYKLAHRDGWRSNGRGWTCPSCYKLEHGLLEERNEPKFDIKAGLEKIRVAAAAITKLDNA